MLSERQLRPLRFEHWKRQTVELAGWRVHLVSYLMDGRYEAQVQTIGSAVTVGYASELTREAAEDRALEQALARFQTSPRTSFDLMVGG